jgi:hypothetical protein
LKLSSDEWLVFQTENKKIHIEFSKTNELDLQLTLCVLHLQCDVNLNSSSRPNIEIFYLSLYFAKRQERKKNGYETSFTVFRADWLYIENQNISAPALISFAFFNYEADIENDIAIVNYFKIDNWIMPCNDPL